MRRRPSQAGQQQSLSERVAASRPKATQTVEEEPKKLLFKGFLSGAAFQTKKGYKGKKLDSLWNRQIIEAFELDDPELANVALESIVADKEARVDGGQHGSPYSIGGYGIFAESQFDSQFQILHQHEEESSRGVYHLSLDEWAQVDKGLKRIAR